LLKEVLEYLRESLEEMALPKMPADQAGKRLFKVLDVAQMRADIMRRLAPRASASASPARGPSPN
jgi:hypothetical protein